jgi:hypothetical protein
VAEIANAVGMERDKVDTIELCEAEVENPFVDSIEAIEATTNKRKADARMNPIIICMCSPLY